MPVVVEDPLYGGKTMKQNPLTEKAIERKYSMKPQKFGRVFCTL